MTKQMNKWMSAVAGVAGGMLTLQIAGAVQAAPAVDGVGHQHRHRSDQDAAGSRRRDA